MVVRRLNPDPDIFEKIQIIIKDVSDELKQYRTAAKEYTHNDLDRLEQLLFNLRLDLLYHKCNPHYITAQILNTLVRSFGPDIHSLRMHLNSNI